MSGTSKTKSSASVHWFRHGLRLHDNQSLLEAIKGVERVYCVFIFDGEVAGTKTAGFNRMRFLLESLEDIDESLKQHGGRLHIFKGQPMEVFTRLFEEWDVCKLTFEEDPEAIWQPRDEAVKQLCNEKGVECVSCVSHTLWNPLDVLDNNGGQPPLTFALFNQVVDVIGDPKRPVSFPDFSQVEMPAAEDHDNLFGVPSLESLGVQPENQEQLQVTGRRLHGGESHGLDLLSIRIANEEESYKRDILLPNQYKPDLLGPTLSLSAHLRFGCVSVRRFYWAIRDAFKRVCPESKATVALTAQLIWREYFYTMSVKNPKYDCMKGNPICLDIPWYTNEQQLQKWAQGKTGFPWIDAAMNQLRNEGWCHHVARHSVSCFLTRGDLWISWEEGLKVFLKYLLDADWSVCAGNWMWVSSSAFENILQCPKCFCPVGYGRRMDPSGEYVRRHVPVLKNFPLKYLFEPWKAPLGVQERAGCVIGKDYPHPMVTHSKAAAECSNMMKQVREMAKNIDVPHCAPSNADEIRDFVWLPDHHLGYGKGSTRALCDGLAETL